MKLLSLFMSTLLIICAGCSQNSNTPSTNDTAHKPTLYIIGDSTVNNTSNDLRGWGNEIASYFDLQQINVINRARGGRSSRTFHTEGLWTNTLNQITPGDYVIIQFGHNDGGPINTGKARASLKGTSDQSKEFIIESTGKPETIYSYGHYLRKFVIDTHAKGAKAIICSPVPRNIWSPDNKTIIRANKDYGLWAKESAQATSAFFIDLNEITAAKFEKLDKPTVSREYFRQDHTHTSAAGAKINAESIVHALKLNNIPLKNYLKDTQ